MCTGTKRAVIFYPLLIFCSCLDFFSIFWVGTHFVYSALGIFAVALSHKISGLRLITLLSILALESFLLYGQWGVQLVYLIPVALFSRSTFGIFTNATYHAVILLVSCLLIQTIIMDTFKTVSLCPIFTLVKILTNILLTVVISLTYV